MAAIEHSESSSDRLGGRLSRRRALQTGAGLAALAAVARKSPALAQQATPAAAGITADGDIAQRLDEFITLKLAVYGVPGAAVSLVHGNQVLLSKGYGVRELGKPGAVDAATVFQLASNSKPMTAAALGALVDAGKMTFDTPVIELLPEFALSDPTATRNCTSRDLLAHRSGLPAFTGDGLGLFGYDRAECLHRVRALDIGGRFREEARYSNIGFFAAGETLARVNGTDWETAMNQRLYQPLGLARTMSMKTGQPADGNASRNHAMVAGVNTVFDWDDSVVFGAAGGIVSTADDMAVWMQMLLAQGGRVLKPETVADIFRPSMVGDISFSEFPPISAETGFDYGLGWGSFHVNGRVVLEKGGALGGIRTVVELIPSLGVGVTVLANQNLTGLPEAIRAFVLEQYLGPSAPDTQDVIESRWRQLLTLFDAPPIPAAVAAASVPLEALIGSYDHAYYGTFRIVAEGAGLAVHAGPAAYHATLQHLNYDAFLLKFPSVTSTGEQIIFSFDANGVPISFLGETYGTFARMS